MKNKPKVTFVYDALTFNTSCVNLFPDNQHVTISIDTDERRLFIEPTEYHDRDALQFANSRNGKNVPRLCVTNCFCQKLFDLMGWNPLTQYHISANFQECGDKKIIVFNLDEARQVFPVEDGKKRRVVNTSTEWKERFGYRKQPCTPTIS